MTNNNPISSKLPKPVTITGSAFPDPEPEVQVDLSEDDTEETDEILPVPAEVFGDEKEEEITVPTPVEKAQPTGINHIGENKAPLAQILPEILPASTDPQSKIADFKPIQITQDEPIPSINLPPLPELSSSDVNDIPNATMSSLAPQPDTNAQAQADDALSQFDSSIFNTPIAQTNTSATDTDTNNQQNYTLPPTEPNMNMPDEISALSGNINPTTIPAISTNMPNLANPNTTSEPVINPYQDYSNQVPANPKKGSKILLGVGVFLIGAGLMVGAYFGITALSKKPGDKPATIAYQAPEITPRPIQTPIPQEASASAVPEATVKASPKATAKTTVKPKSADTLAVQILNGSGKKGDAIAAKNLIEDDKYDISTGNADNFDYLGLTIEYKDSQETIASNIAKKLENTYGKATMESTLKTESEFDIVITLGVVSNSDSTPEPSPES